MARVNLCILCEIIREWPCDSWPTLLISIVSCRLPFGRVEGARWIKQGIDLQRSTCLC